MGVKNLWPLLSPAARPVQLESLRNRKLAIDASIWIHQFMRTMRSEDGQVLTNGHLLGFFRRICKLLFYDIKPVFVFDGGAPTLKLSTLRERRRRREGVQTNVQLTAKKILKAQMKQQLIVEEKRRRNNQMEESEENNEQLDNFEAIQLLKHQNTIKQDQYDLPPSPHETNIDRDRRIKKDLRLATSEELQDFINEFKPSDIDMDSATFHALPTEIQYEIIQDLKLKSRQTSWARLNNMVQHSKTAMDFSKQQILQLKHRNEMTQRVFKMNDMVGQDNNNDTISSSIPSRIASERGKAYLLVKNEKLEEGLGWKLPGSNMAVSTGLTNQKVDEEDDDNNKIKMETDVFIEEGEVEDHDDTLNKPSVNGFDPVENAIKDNPALSSLMEGFFNSEQHDGDDNDDHNDGDNKEMEEQHLENEMDTFDEYDFDSDDDELPLFINQQPEYKKYQPSITHPEESGGIYEADDDEIAINQVLFKMYNDEQQQQQINNNNRNPPLLNNTESLTGIDNNNNNNNGDDQNIELELELSSEEFYQLWLSRVPDAFIYMHSLNDAYKNILKKATNDTTEISDLEQQIKSVQKLFGKSNESDTITQTSLGFHQQFLNNVILWKKYHTTTVKVDDNDNDDQVNYDDSEISKETLVDKQHNINIHILEDDDKDTDADTDADGNEESGYIDGIQYSQLNNHVSTTDDLTLMKDVTEKNEITDGMKKTKKTIDVVDDDGDETIMDQEEEDADIKKELEEAQTMEYVSDDELIQHAEDEDAEYARFISDIASRDLDTVKEELANDLKELNQKQYKQLGNADTMTDQMVQEIQELLQLFGIPFLVSPMEAEAQCSFLLENKLVDGVVTDDSDVFLFGGNRIYKNMFHQQKYVECYLLNDIDREMQLDRKKLIQLAFLLGSDYTPGIPGIGPVTAMEILSAFQNTDDDDDSVEEPLIRFKKWYDDGIDNTDFQKKLRNKLKHLDIPDDFPNPLIKDAYYEPVVDKSLENFVWLPPQLDSLRIYLMKSFSWSEEKTDEVLIPVIREMNQNKINTQQPTINSYFDVSAGMSSNYSSQKRKHKSKRVQNVVNQLRKQKKRKL